MRKNNKNQNRKSLRLDTQIVRTLRDDDLERVAGAAKTDYCPTVNAYTCITCRACHPGTSGCPI